MLLALCKMLARAIRGHRRTEARPGPPRAWRGEPLAAVGAYDPSDDPHRTLSIRCVPDGPVNRPPTGSPPVSPTPDAAGAGRTALPAKAKHSVA
jgi:hypothetical protein